MDARLIPMRCIVCGDLAPRVLLLDVARVSWMLCETHAEDMREATNRSIHRMRTIEDRRRLLQALGEVL